MFVGRGPELTEMEKEILAVLTKLQADEDAVNEKYKDFTGLDGPGAAECRKLTKAAFEEIDRIKKKWRKK